MERIELAFFQKHLNKLILRENDKLNSIVEWLECVLKNGLQHKELTVNTLLPKKEEFATVLKVGIGTVQNVYRALEDKGIVVSKQCVGTILVYGTTDKLFEKSTSKKDFIVNAMKKSFIKADLKCGDKISSVRYYSKLLKASTSLVLQVLEQLQLEGVIENNNGDRYLCVDRFKVNSDAKSTLVEKTYGKLKEYIAQNLKVNDKLMPVNKLAKYFGVSQKTIHSAVNKLVTDGILVTLAGQYGTVVVRIPDDKTFYQKPETSIFALSQETYYYRYERILNVIRKMIYDNFEVGAKLPSISELAMLLDVNTNTIRKTFEVLSSEGIVSTVRGRYGGTFVIELPDFESTQSYKWLAIDSSFSIQN